MAAVEEQSREHPPGPVQRMTLSIDTIDFYNILHQYWMCELPFPVSIRPEVLTEAEQLWERLVSPSKPACRLIGHACNRKGEYIPGKHQVLSFAHLKLQWRSSVVFTERGQAIPVLNGMQDPAWETLVLHNDPAPSEATDLLRITLWPYKPKVSPGAPSSVLGKWGIITSLF